MTTSRCFLGALLLVSACISRGSGGTDTPPPGDDGGIDAPVTAGDAPATDMNSSDRAPRRDVPCAPTRSSREDTAAECSDGLDNDCNGFGDCDDFNCRTCAVPACLTNNTVTLRDGGTCMCGAPESTMAACSDGLDNDCDGFTDCQDFSCQTCAVPVCLRDGGLQRGDAGFCACRGEENTNEACSDGVDNDCNGFTDCNDFSCSRSDAGVITVCARDGGTHTDAGRCDAPVNENTNALCNDGIDNDCNGHTDCEDFSCRSCAITACVRDGGVTLRDGGTCACRGEENTNAACGDGVDNDCDGFVDCRDFDCTMSDGGVVTVCPTDGGTATDIGRD